MSNYDLSGSVVAIVSLDFNNLYIMLSVCEQKGNVGLCIHSNGIYTSCIIRIDLVKYTIQVTENKLSIPVLRYDLLCDGPWGGFRSFQGEGVSCT